MLHRLLLLLQVRLLVAAAGLQLLALHRVRVGGWVMPRSLKQGSYM
jgi:16S rRNA U516 pseudouridylate synthase RsuA-like enzyme